MFLGIAVSLVGRLKSGVSQYAVAGFEPALVFDFDDEYYRTSGSSTTFSSAITHSRAGNATMVDSDGVLKWAPHNLALNSATPATQSITVVSGADYTVECTGVSIALSGAGTGTVTEGNPVTITASTATLTLTVTGSSGTMWAYRSDLGGMVNNPDTGDSYVPTTSSAVYLPRRGHHVYNGSAWVNEGLLHESELRVNLFTYNKLNDAALQSTSQTLGSNVLIEGSAQGITAEVVATGLENGTPYLDWQISGTENGTGTAFIDIVDTNSVAAAPGDQATVSGYFKLVSGSIPADNYVQLYFHWKDAANVLLSSPGLHIGSDIGGSLERFHFTATAPATTTQIVNKGLYVRVPSGATVDFTIRVGLPQAELAATPSSPMLTTGSTATRAAETLTIPAANLPWSSSAVSIQMDGLETFADEGSATQENLFDWQVDSNNRITLALDTDSAKVGTLTLTMVNGSGTDETISTTAELTPGINDPFNVSIVCTSNEIGIALDGTAETRVSHSIGLPDLSGADATLGGNGTRALLRVWNQDITNAGQEAATT